MVYGEQFPRDELAGSVCHTAVPAFMSEHTRAMFIGVTLVKVKNFGCFKAYPFIHLLSVQSWLLRRGLGLVMSSKY